MSLRQLLVRPKSVEQRVLPSKEQVVILDPKQAKSIKGSEAVVGVDLSKGNVKTIVANKPISSMQGYFKCKVAGFDKFGTVGLVCDRAYVSTNLNMDQQEKVQAALISLR